MELENPRYGEYQTSEDPGNGQTPDQPQPNCFLDDLDSTCSTPYVSAPSSPGRGGPSGYFFSAPASPMHFVLSSSPYTCESAAASSSNSASDVPVSGSFEFEFSARFSSTVGGATATGSMISADELFLNGKIRPMKLASHLQRPQVLAPLLDLEAEDEDDEEAKDKYHEPVVRGRDLRLRNRSLHRRTRSMSPMRNAPFQWHDEEEEVEGRRGDGEGRDMDLEIDPELKQTETPTPSESASSSRSSSTSGRNSKRWIFLKDLLYRSKSEGRGNAKEKFWYSISFSPSKEKSSSLFSRDKSKDSKPPSISPSSITATASSSTATSESQKPKHKKLQASASSSSSTSKKSSSSKPMNGVGKRRMPGPSAHERHYTTNRAQAEEMRKKTFLPYRQGLLGCLGFSSRSYGAMNGFAKTLNPVSSR